MNLLKPFDSLKLNDYLFFDKQVDTVTTIEKYFSVFHRKRILALYLKTAV